MNLPNTIKASCAKENAARDTKATRLELIRERHRVLVLEERHEIFGDDDAEEHEEFDLW